MQEPEHVAAQGLGPIGPVPPSVRRRNYLLLIPVGVLFSLLAWLVTEAGTPTQSAHRLLLLGMTLWLTLLFVVFWRDKQHFAQLELILFLSVCLYFLARLVVLMVVGQDAQAFLTELDKLGHWLPALYALAFLIFGGRRGIMLSLLLYASMLVLPLAYLAPVLLEGSLPELYDHVSNIYLANLLLIAVFAIFARTSERHAQTAIGMNQLAHTDALTGISNRRRLEALLAEETVRATRYQLSFSLILLDLDHFKRVNDEHGHAVGDRVLRELVSLVSTEIRMVDRFGRWGGEEFLIILPETELEQAQQLAQRLRSSIEAHAFSTVGKLTASLGVAAFKSEGTLEALLEQVDDALYQAKAEGRNCVVTA